MAGTSYLASLLIVLFLGALFLAMLYGLIQLSKSWKIALIERVLRAVRRRRNTKDSFRQNYGYSWDYFMAFKVYDEDEEVSEYQREFSLTYILDRLTAGGLEVRLFYSLQRKEIFCKIRCPLERIQRHADLVDMRLALDSEELEKLCKAGRDGLWEPLKLPDESPMTLYKPYEHIYAKYEYDAENNCTEDDMLPIFKKWPRITAEKLEEEIRQIQQSYIGNTASVNNTLNTVNLISLGRYDSGFASGDASTMNPITQGDKTIDPESTDVEPRRLQESACFRSVDRMKLIHMIINHGGPGGCGLDVYQLIKDNCILAYGPLHDMVELRDLESLWVTFFAWPWEQPFDKIKNYFGEKIGLYFLWLGTYTAWLIPAAIVGFFIWINVAAEANNPNAPAIPYFCGFMGLWSALFLENWKRTEKTTAMKWGMVGFEEEEQPRPQFTGEKMRSPVTGKWEVYYPRFRRSMRETFSQSVITVMVLVVIAAIGAIFALRIVMANAKIEVAGVQIASIVASILIAFQIQVLNGVFGDVALRLNNQENHRTDTEYEDALIAKTFLFQFVNSFASLFYISFVKPFIQSIDSCNGSCMLELQQTLATIFLTRLAIGNLTELGIPMVKTILENRKRNEAVKSHKAQQDFERQALQDTIAAQKLNGTDGLELSIRGDTSESLGDTSNLDPAILAARQKFLEEGKYEMSEIEKAYAMEEYHVMLGPFDDYAEMVIQFGYTTMFIAGFPLATVMSLVNNYVEIRVDAWKLCHVCRRPEPRSCEDIGTWGDILEIVSYASIFVNSALVAFTTNITVDYIWTERIWIFILMASGLFVIRWTIAWLIPDTPVEVAIQLERQEYICRKVCDNVEDDDDEGLGKNNFITPDYRVLATDDDPM
jgi:anoctamin-10/anoctamin-7